MRTRRAGTHRVILAVRRATLAVLLGLVAFCSPRRAVSQGDSMTAPAPPSHTNRLIHEKSPYLLQHAHNPVDWYPWGAEAFAAARAQNKPLFLSIGYSTCYWCHVMEKESFEDSTVAAAINAHFIPVKVDREERPDIDAIYMAGVQAMTGQGGWPMTVFVTPEGKPFWGGTYFPPHDRDGHVGLMTILASLSDAWTTRHADVLQSSEALSEAIRAHGAGARDTTGGGAPPLSDAAIRAAVTSLERTYDSTYGGFGGAPKFPRPHTLALLLRWWSRTHDERTLASVTHTLTQMARGGIHDQIGGGFHRYSTDRQWLVPHFEKMLYDQALLARVYCEAWQITGDASFAVTARDICDYVLRDMRDPAGGLYAAEDAGDVGKEGEFYVWSPADLDSLLPAADAGAVRHFYDVSSHGNFEHGMSILHQVTSVEALAPVLKRDPPDLAHALAAARTTLLAARDRRARPHRDDKVLTDWNGLMISALAYCGRALDEPRYVEAACTAADFALTHCQRDGVLLHRWRDGEAAIPGFLDDYAFLSAGLLDLYEATFEPRWLGESVRLARAMTEQFADTARGGFYFTGARNDTLIARSKDLYDGAAPSGNSVAATTLVRLGLLTQDRDLSAAAERSFAAFSATVHATPSAFPQFLIAYDLQMGPAQEIVLAGDPASPVMRGMIGDVHRRFLPRAVLALAPGGPAGEELARIAPFTAQQVPVAGAPTAYICQNYACQLPTTDEAAFAAQLDGLQ